MSLPGRTRSIAQNACAMIRIVALVLLAAGIYTNVLAREGALPIAGWVERAMLFPDGLAVRAKLDTGARTSSLSAVDPVFFMQDGERWVRFTLTTRWGRTAILERPVVRLATIKRHFGHNQKRPVINLDICVGPVRKTVEVNLVDRTGLNYQLLIGRNFLAGDLIVDSGSTDNLSSQCPGSAQ